MASRPGRARILQLEGELLEPWVETVRDACTQRGRRSKGLRLDLAAVTYVDAAGAQLLRELMRESIAIAASRSCFDTSSGMRLASWSLSASS